MIKALTFDKDLKIGNSATYLTTISFSVVLYLHYTQWVLIDFYFLAEDKPEI